MRDAEQGAGRELDAAVAAALGLPLEVPCARYHSTDDAQFDATDGEWYGWCYTCAGPIRDVAPVALRYSTDIDAAWDVVEAFDRTRNFSVVRRVTGEWSASVYIRTGALLQTADTAPLAICLCAVAAVEADAPHPTTEGARDE